MKKFLLDFLLVLLGNALLAFAYAVFAIPANLIVGGVTGISILISRFTHIDYALIVWLFNMLMLVLGYCTLGKKFAAGTILSSFAYPFFLGLFEKIEMLQNISSDVLLCTIYAGLFAGIGLGIVFRLGYSTGGIDVPVILLSNKTNVSVGTYNNIADVIILSLQVFITSIEGILYGIITVLVTNFILDKVILLGEKNLQVFVVTSKYEEITNTIIEKLNRGVTYVNIKTGYLHNDYLAVMSVVSNREYPLLNELILDIDPTAFIITSEIHSVKGRGFTLPDVDL